MPHAAELFLIANVDSSLERLGEDARAELIVIGAGAAGLATAIFAARAAPACRIVCVDSARHIGAKILVSGGSRCNVTNRSVSERDFWGGSTRFVRNVLRAFPEARAIDFFSELGVSLHEEEDGKLFPDSNTSRAVLQALMSEADRLGIVIVTGERVTALEVVGRVPPETGAPEGGPASHRFVTTTATGRTFRSHAVVMSTGGRSLPKTGSDGFGYELARRFGHGCVDPIPALAPLLFDGWEPLAGVAHPAAMTLRVDGRAAVTLAGPLLWTHFGASGPLALNMSRHWHRAHAEGRACAVTVDVCPGDTFDSLDGWLRAQEQSRPRSRVATIVGARVPNAVAERWVGAAGIEPELTIAHLTREHRHALVRTLRETALPVRGSRGFAYAEVTAGGVPLDEVDSATMESRLCPNLFFTGEILDVDGRLGGFNFQWAWSSAWVAAQAIARVLVRLPATRNALRRTREPDTTT